MNRLRDPLWTAGVLQPGAALADGDQAAPASRPQYQGYVEGKFVYVASPQSGPLDRLSVTRGETVKAQATRCSSSKMNLRLPSARQASRRLRTSSPRGWPISNRQRPPEVEVTRAQLDAGAWRRRTQAGRILSELQGAISRRGHRANRPDQRAGSGGVESTAKVRETRSRPGSGRAARARTTDQSAAAARLPPDRARAGRGGVEIEQKQIASPRQGPGLRHSLSRGEWVPAGTPVVQLLPPENLEVRFFVPESRLGRAAGGTRSFASNCDGCSADCSPPQSPLSPRRPNTRRQSSTATRIVSKLVFMIIATAAACRKRPLLHPGQPVRGHACMTPRQSRPAPITPSMCRPQQALRR